MTFVFALLALAILATPAFAQQENCIQNEFNIASGASSTSTAASTRLNCTANDVRIAKVSNVRNPATGQGLPSCQSGDTNVSFIADFQVVTTASSTRSNIGMYIAKTGTTTADALSVHNSCADNLIPPPPDIATRSRPVVGATNAQFPCDPAVPSVLCGTDWFDEYDPAPDSCGDSSSNDDGGGVASTQIVTLLITGFTCPSPVGLPNCTVNGVTGPCAVLPNCTSWQVPGKTIACSAPSGQQSWNISAIPGDKSKCNCETIQLPILIQSPTISVAKTCTTSNQTNAANCTLTPEGGTVTYNVTISNTSNFGTVTIDQICDSAFGNLGTVSGFTPACATGNTATGGTQAGRSALVSGANGCSVPQTLTAAGTTGATYTCSFQANQIENVTVDDTVTANGLGADGKTPASSSSTQVEVVSNEATTAGTITKGVVSTKNACVTVRYKAQVANTSTAGTDETLTLSSFNDDTFASITTLHGNNGTSGSVIGTTCGVATAIGTLAVTGVTGNGAGALPVTLNPGDTYPASTFNSGFCNFDGVLCGTAATQGCTIGFSDTDHLSAGLTDDEGNAVTLTPGSATVNACINVN